MARGGKRGRKTSEPGLLGGLGAFFQGRRPKAPVSPHAQEIKALLMLGSSLWLFIAMASYYAPFDDPAAVGRNWGGQVGFYLANAAFISSGRPKMQAARDEGPPAAAQSAQAPGCAFASR